MRFLTLELELCSEDAGERRLLGDLDVRPPTPRLSEVSKSSAFERMSGELSEFEDTSDRDFERVFGGAISEVGGGLLV